MKVEGTLTLILFSRVFREGWSGRYPLMWACTVVIKEEFFAFL